MSKKRKIPGKPEGIRAAKLMASIDREMNRPRMAQSVRSACEDEKAKVPVAPRAARRPLASS